MKLLALLLSCLISVPSVAQVPLRQRIELSPINTIVLRGPVDETSVTKLQFDLAAQVIKRGMRGYPLYLVLDSPGGDIEAGISFIEFAKTVPNLHTISIFSASMASAIVQQLPGERLITNNGMLMFHRARGGFQGQFENGELESRLIMAKRLVRGMEQINAGRMRMHLADYKSLVLNELWLDAEQSIVYRAADRVVDVICTPALVDERETVNIQVFIFSATLSFSRCPTFRGPVADSTNVYKIPSTTNFNYWLRALGGSK